MILINYPEQKPRIRSQAGREEIFCLSRKRWVALTPEEWVRQNFLLFLSLTLNYPESLLAVERMILVNERRRRFDIVAFNPEGHPILIVECKEMNVPLDEKVMNQLLAYRSVVPAGIFAITNGINCIAFESKNGTANVLTKLPEFVRE